MVKIGPFSFFEKKPLIGLAEAGIGIVSKSNFWSDSKVDDAPQNIKLQQMYNNAYNNFGIVSAAIDIQAEQIVQDFYFEGPNSDKLEKFADKHNLGHKFYLKAKQLIRNGNCWVELPKNRGKIINF